MMHKQMSIRFVVSMLLAGGALLLAGRAAVGSATQPEKDVALSLGIDLADGSQIIGVPSIRSVRVQTAYAEMDLPLEQIASIRMRDDGETASIELRNGDSLTGAPSLDPLKLRTVFGDISLGAEHLRSIHVRAAGAVGGGLILHYSFDKDEGAKVTDKSGGKHDGENRGAGWIPNGPVGGAFQFSSGTHVRIPHSADFEFPDGDFSAALWLRPDTLELRGSDAATLLDFESGGWRGWMLRFSQYYPSITLGGGGDERPVICSPPPIGQWTFVAVAYSEKRRELKGYVDGKPDMRQPLDLSLTRSPTDHAIGVNPEIPSQYFNGAIDEVMVFSRMLSDGEVDALYRRGERGARASSP
jgi:hypothetical protein